MGIIYFDKKAFEVPTLEGWLPELGFGQRTGVDTETSGLYGDGDYKEAPPARISAVSIAWYCDGHGDGRCGRSDFHRHSLAMPFDQGFIGGKPGKWSDDINGYEKLPHTQQCQSDWHSGILRNGECSCAPWNFGVDEYYRLISWLANRPLVMHHQKFDAHMFDAGLRNHPETAIDLMPNVEWDTMLAQGVIEPLFTSSLKPTCSRKWRGEHPATEQQAVKDALKRNGTGLTWRYDLIDWKIVGPYAGEDADMTIHLADHQWEAIDNGEVDADDQAIITQELKLSKLLYEMERRGIGLDAELMAEQARLMEAEVARVAETLPFKPANSNAAKEWFYETLKLVPIKTTTVCKLCSFNTATGKSRRKNIDATCKHVMSPSLDTEVTARLAHEGVKGAREWQHLANLNSALSKWYRAWPNLCGSDGRIRTVFRQGRIESDRKGQTSGGAISGRLSTERVQTQGVPLDYKIPPGIVPVKKLFRAKPGFEVHEFDLSNAEVRVAAWLLQSPTLAAAVSSMNVHDHNTRLMFGIEPDHADWDMYRKIAKTTILGLFFSAGVRTLKGQIEMATGKDYKESKVKEFMELSLKVVPELRSVSRMMERKASKNLGGCGYIRLVNGRRRWFGWAERTYKAFNSGTQGGVAETMKAWMLMLEAEYPGMLINQVHDSVWMEIPIERVVEVQAGVIASGEKLFSETFSTPEIPIPFKVDVKRLA
jgi:DNA polymerase I-like protein with 3'-5' exonuclease and polymerase domains